jgi:hypothetical protein
MDPAKIAHFVGNSSLFDPLSQNLKESWNCQMAIISTLKTVQQNGFQERGLPDCLDRFLHYISNREIKFVT